MDSNKFLRDLNDKLKENSADALKSEAFISEITNQNVKLLDIIGSLGEVLTNEDKIIRERGVDILSWILAEIPSDFLNERETTVVMNFYCDRLKDHHSLLPAVIRGLLAIVKMEKAEKEAIVQMLTQLFQHVNCQGQPQKDRNNIYHIFKFIIENRLDDVRIMGPDFLFGVISFIDSETDPKNLMLLFEFLPVFLRNFPLGHLVEEVFEVLSCYFPIDFNAAAKNNSSITRDDLSNALIECLSSVREFCQFCLLLILEKLESSLKQAKLDSYKLLRKCCAIYKTEDVEKFATPLWKAMQKDVLSGNDKQISEEALKSLASLVKLLSNENEKELFTNFLNDVLASAKTLLTKVDDSLFQPAANILAAASSDSTLACEYIIEHLNPYCKPDFTKLASERRIILSSFLPFLTFSENSHSIDLSQMENLFLDSTTFNDSNVRKLAYVGIEKLVLRLNESNRKRLYLIIVDSIKKEDSNDVRDECLKVVRILASSYHIELMDVIKTRFLISEEIANIETIRLLTALSIIADLPHFKDYVFPLLLNVVTNSLNYSVGLECLLKACRSKPPQFYKTLSKDYDIVEKLITWYFDKLNDSSHSVLLTLAKIVAVIIRNQETKEQQIFVDEYAPLFLNGIHKNEALRLELLDPASKSITAVVLLEAILGSVNQGVNITSRLNLESKLKTIALDSDDILARASSSRLLASLLNKSSQSEVKDALVRISKEISAVLESSDSSKKIHCAELFTWITKGIILRGFDSFEEWITKWFDLLNNEDVGKTIAEGFRTIMEEDELYLNLESHCNVKILYRQRLFCYFSQLVDKYQTSDASVKPNYLLALIQLIQSVPKHVVLTNISSVIVLLIQALDSENREILLPSLEILSSLLEDEEESFSNYVQSFMDKFLRLSQYDGSMKIRIHALKCVFNYGFYPTSILLPYKHKVIRELEPCLDDKKRLVRSQAVKARSRWYLVGAPGDMYGVVKI